MADYSLESYDFKALAKKESDKRIYQRLMMLAYLKEGMSKAQVSRLTFTAPDRVYAWLKRFLKRGIEGLRDKPRSGRPSLLDRSAYDALQQKIEDSQSLLSGGRLRGENIIQLVKDEWGVEYTLSGIYRLMKAIGMSWGSTRSKHPKQDEKAQQQFKKTLLS
jgi:transposase